jgi:hypothetical protein
MISDLQTKVKGHFERLQDKQLAKVVSLYEPSGGGNAERDPELHEKSIAGMGGIVPKTKPMMKELEKRGRKESCH